MDASEILRLYDLACEKAARNSRKIGSELREFPASETGDYFSQNRASLRGIEHIFGWTQSFFTGMALLAGAHTGNFSLIRRIPCMTWDSFIRCTAQCCIS